MKAMRVVILFTVFSLSLALHANDRRQTLNEAQDEEAFVGWQGENYNAQETFGDKGWIETLSWEPRAYLWHNFLTDEEADHLIELAKPHMKKSEVVDSDTGNFKQTLDRTSSGYFLRRGEDEVVARIEQRIADWTKLPVENGEPLHVVLCRPAEQYSHNNCVFVAVMVLHYQKGEQYVEHWDYFHDTVNTQNGGQRVATALMYLSEVDQGGETVFPSSTIKPSAEELKNYSVCGQAGMAVKPRKGDCLLFWDLKPDGVSKDTKSLHAGCPVCPDGNPDGKLKCDKWSATKWIRAREHKVWR